MCLRSTPLPLAVAAGAAFVGEGEGGIKIVVPQAARRFCT